MKISISAKTLAKTLAAAARIVEKKTTISILTHLRIEAANKLMIVGTDLDVEYRTELEAKIDGQGACCAPAGPLADIVRKIDEKAEVHIELVDGQLSVRAGRSRFKLSTLSSDEFPELAAKDLPHRFSLPLKAVSEMIDRTAFAISTEETRYYLNGIYLHCLDVDGCSTLRGVATDGHRLARFDLPAPEGAAGMPGVIVPRKMIEILARMTKEAGEGEASISLSMNQIRFDFGATSVTSKLIDGTFPDYARVIPSSSDKRAYLNAETLAQSVARVGAITSERGRAVKFQFSNGQLALSVTNPETGEARDEIDVEWDGHDFEVGFNSGYVQTILACLGAERIAMKFTDPGAPCVLVPADSAAMLAVLMPMRV